MAGVAILAAVVAVLLAVPPRPVAASLVAGRGGPTYGGEVAWPRRFRLPLAALAALAGVTFVGGVRGLAVALLLGSGVWVVGGRAESPAVRRDREQVRRELPQVVRLLGLALASGSPVPAALGVVADAWPGPAAVMLAGARDRMVLGVPPGQVWDELGAHPGLEPLARALERSGRTGASSAEVVARLADELAARDRADVEDRARAVGIRAAVPLGVCLLPAFVLLGIVPVIAATLAGLGW